MYNTTVKKPEQKDIFGGTGATWAVVSDSDRNKPHARDVFGNFKFSALLKPTEGGKTWTDKFGITNRKPEVRDIVIAKPKSSKPKYDK